MKETNEENAAVLAAYEITARKAEHMIRSDAFDTSSATVWEDHRRHAATLPGNGAQVAESYEHLLPRFAHGRAAPFRLHLTVSCEIISRVSPQQVEGEGAKSRHLSVMPEND